MKTAANGIAVLVFLAGAVFCLRPAAADATAAQAAGAQPQPTPVRRRARTAVPARASKYSAFAHNTKAHRADCSTCHKFPSSNWNKVRAAAEAFPDVTEYPKHESCVGCHTQQFFRGAKPAICSICHTDPSPRNSARHPFPNPREIFDKSAKGKRAESDFVIGFPHDKHADIVTASALHRPVFANAAYRTPAAAEESCAVCHQTMEPQGASDVEYLVKPPSNLGDGYWLKKGTFKSVPLGHSRCFTCHSADTGILPAPQTCSACHQLKPAAGPADFDPKAAAAMSIDNKPMLDLWKRRDSSVQFRHEFMAHVELSCSSCHNTSTMNTAVPATKKVPISSCAMCHVTATADDGGALNYEVDKRKADPAFQCSKCHVSFGKLPIPASHTSAIAEAAGK